MTNTASRGRWLASLLAAFTAGAAILLLQTGGSAFGSASSVQYEYGHPAPVQSPVVSGGAAETGQKLTTTNGTWTSATPITLYAYAWGRCDANGNNCGAIAGSTSNTYTLTVTDVGHTIRSYVSAVSANGLTQNQSVQTAVVRLAYPTGKVVDEKQVVLPNRLIIDKVSYSANPIRSRTVPTQMRVHVADSHQNSVQNALVYVVALPYSRVASMPEVRTAANGWAILSLRPGQFFPRSGYVVLFVRARVEGQDVIGGTSTRRLVQDTIAPPSG